jgi:bifunctional UDP-N-acetylglucosamine pyrophosphorylase/glucosamine-1-phosphate N-acetyltransferase
VLYADQPSVTTAMVSNLINTHASSITPLTMATVTVPHFDDWYQVFYRGFSRIVRGVDGQIIKSVEFKDATDEEKNIRELNPAYFCFDRQWLFDNLETIKNENNQGEYYLTDLVKIAATNGGIASVPISPEEALGVNSIEELERLEQLQKNKD